MGQIILAKIMFYTRNTITVLDDSYTTLCITVSLEAYSKDYLARKLWMIVARFSETPYIIYQPGPLAIHAHAVPRAKCSHATLEDIDPDGNSRCHGNWNG